MKSYVNTNRIYRDEARRKISGVCAGLARHFNQEPWIARVIAIAAFVMFPVATALAYVLAVLLIPTRY